MSKVEPSASADEAELERLDDEALARLVRERANQPTIPVSVEHLAEPVGWVPPDGDKRPKAVTRQAETAADLLARILKHRDSILGTRLTSRRAKGENDVLPRDSLPPLPGGWVWARLDEIADIKGGITKDKKRDPEDCVLLPYLRVANVQRGFLDLSEMKEIPVPKESVGALLLEPGDVLFNEGGDRDKLGRGWVWNGQIRRCVFQNHVFRARLYLRDSMEPKFISWYANTFGQDYFMAKGKQTTNLASINKTMLSAFPVPIAPLDQQKRIVAEIEKQFSRLDEAVANLKRVKANLKRYKAAVLKAAVEGRLVETEAERARREGRSYETGAQLLQCILKTRRSQWQGKGIYKEPAAPDTTDLPELPEGWVWATVEQLAFVDVGYAFKSNEFEVDGIRLLRGENIEPGRLRWDDTRYWPEEKLDNYRSFLVQEGEIILAMDRPIVTAGLKLARARQTDLPCLLVQRMARMRCIWREMEGYLYVAMQTHRFEQHLLGGQTGTQLPHISGSGIASFLVPLQPALEQHRIVAEVDRRLSLLRKTEAQVVANLQRAERLRQSILASAFYPYNGDHVTRAIA